MRIPAACVLLGLLGCSTNQDPKGQQPDIVVNAVERTSAVVVNGGGSSGNLGTESQLSHFLFELENLQRESVRKMDLQRTEEALHAVCVARDRSEEELWERAEAVLNPAQLSELRLKRMEVQAKFQLAEVGRTSVLRKIHELEWTMVIAVDTYTRSVVRPSVSQAFRGDFVRKRDLEESLLGAVNDSDLSAFDSDPLRLKLVFAGVLMGEISRKRTGAPLTGERINLFYSTDVLSVAAATAALVQERFLDGLPGSTFDDSIAAIELAETDLGQVLRYLTEEDEVRFTPEAAVVQTAIVNALAERVLSLVRSYPERVRTNVQKFVVHLDRAAARSAPWAVELSKVPAAAPDGVMSTFGEIVTKL